MPPDLTISEVQNLAMQEFDDPQVVGIVFGGGAGGGKMLDVSTPIPTPDGWKLNGDLEDGDTVYAIDGTETRVLRAHPIKDGETYRVSFDDGTYIDADAEHLWYTETYNERKNSKRRTESSRQKRRLSRNDTHKEWLVGKNVKKVGQIGNVRTTLEIKETLTTRNGTHTNHAIPNARYIEGSKRLFTIPPYVLGAWLGDGSQNAAYISGVDSQIFDNIRHYGYTTTDLMSGCGVYVKGLKVQLRSVGVLSNKHIPAEYLRASADQRLMLLRGLMDTDGTIDKHGKASFTNTNYAIIEGFCELVASLGLKYSCIESDKNQKRNPNHKIFWTVYFRPPFICFGIDRKANRQDLTKYRSTNSYRYIVSVEKIENVKMRCITIEHESHVYLAGKQMVPTHNSFLIGLLCAIACKKYPGTRWGLARKELKSLKQTTLATLISKVHRVLGISDNDYKLNLLDSTLEYSNGSQILLLDLTAKPSDPEMESLGSLELTGAFVDEIGEVNKKAHDVLASRVNRWLNKEYGITGKVVSSCNPSPGFVRQEYYDKYYQLGAGRMQKWKSGHVWVGDERVDAYSVYIRSTALDNPFIDRNYVEGLRRLPPQERKRLLDGDWNYLDEDDSLFPMALIDKMTVYEVPEPEDGKFNKFIGVDPSDAGKDDTVVTLVDNGVIAEQFEIKSPQGKDDAIGFYIAGKLINFAETHGFTKPTAKSITIEGNGVGASLRDALRTLGWNVNVYTATLQSRNDGYYQFMLDADEGRIKLLNTVIEKGQLIRQLTAHRYDLDTGKPRITRKKDLRQLLGRSPDHADSAMIANMAANKFKPKNISSYIRW